MIYNILEETFNDLIEDYTFRSCIAVKYNTLKDRLELEELLSNSGLDISFFEIQWQIDSKIEESWEEFKNEEIEELNNTIDDLENTIESLEDKISSLQDKNYDLKYELEDANYEL